MKLYTGRTNAYNINAQYISFGKLYMYACKLSYAVIVTTTSCIVHVYNENKDRDFRGYLHHVLHFFFPLLTLFHCGLVDLLVGS